MLKFDTLFAPDYGTYQGFRTHFWEPLTLYLFINKKGLIHSFDIPYVFHKLCHFMEKTP